MDEQTVVFNDDDLMEQVVKRASVDSLMFLQWMEDNKQYPKSKRVDLCAIPLKIRMKEVEELDESIGTRKKSKRWVPKQHFMSRGRIFYVHTNADELHYLRLLLNILKGSMCYNDIKTVNDIVHRTFKDACYSLSLLEDDKEYVKL